MSETPRTSGKNNQTDDENKKTVDEAKVQALKEQIAKHEKIVKQAAQAREDAEREFENKAVKIYFDDERGLRDFQFKKAKSFGNNPGRLDALDNLKREEREEHKGRIKGVDKTTTVVGGETKRTHIAGLEELGIKYKKTYAEHQAAKSDLDRMKQELKAIQKGEKFEPDKHQDKRADKAKDFEKKIDNKVNKLDKGHRSFIERFDVITPTTHPLLSKLNVFRTDETEAAFKKAHDAKQEYKGAKQGVKDSEKVIKNELKNIESIAKKAGMGKEDIEDLLEKVKSGKLGFEEKVVDRIFSNKAIQNANHKIQDAQDDIKQEQTNLDNKKEALNEARTNRAEYAQTAGDIGRSVKEGVKSFVNKLRGERNNNAPEQTR